MDHERSPQLQDSADRLAVIRMTVELAVLGLAIRRVLVDDSTSWDLGERLVAVLLMVTISFALGFRYAHRLCKPESVRTTRWSTVGLVAFVVASSALLPRNTNLLLAAGVATIGVPALLALEVQNLRAGGTLFRQTLIDPAD